LLFGVIGVQVKEKGKIYTYIYQEIFLFVLSRGKRQKNRKKKQKKKKGFYIQDGRENINKQQQDIRQLTLHQNGFYQASLLAQSLDDTPHISS
jgi:hypothetical protein